MFLISKPGEPTVRAFLDSQQGKPFSYPEVGASSAAAPDGYNVDHNRIQLGRGGETLDKAIEAVRDWKMFDFNWIKVVPKRAPIKVGTTVAVLVRHFGFYSLNASRIVYTIDAHDSIKRYGFAYGTLVDHAEQGEERFSVEHLSDDTVWYDLLAFSKPRHPLARLGYPISRFLQKQFARESLQAMFRAVNK